VVIHALTASTWNAYMATLRSHHGRRGSPVYSDGS